MIGHLTIYRFASYFCATYFLGKYIFYIFLCFSWREDCWNHSAARVSAGDAGEPGQSAAVHGRQEGAHAPDLQQRDPRGEPQGGDEAHPGPGGPLQAGLCEAS